MNLISVKITNNIPEGPGMKKPSDVWEITQKDPPSGELYCHSCRSKNYFNMNDNNLVVCVNCGKPIKNYMTFLRHKETGQNIPVRQKVLTEINDWLSHHQHEPFNIDMITEAYEINSRKQLIQLPDYNTSGDSVLNTLCFMFDVNRMTPSIDYRYDQPGDYVLSRNMIAANDLAYISLDRDEFKVITYKTSSETRTINTFASKETSGLVIAGDFDDDLNVGDSLIELTLKNNFQNKFFLYKVVRNDRNSFDIEKKEITNRNNIKYYSDLDAKYPYGTRFKIKLYPGNDLSRIYLPNLLIMDSGEYTKNSDLYKTFSKKYPDVHISLNQDLKSLSGRELVDLLRDQANELGKVDRTRYRGIVIAGFDIPKQQLRQLKDIPYIIKYTGNEEKPFIVIRSN